MGLFRGAGQILFEISEYLDPASEQSEAPNPIPTPSAPVSDTVAEGSGISRNEIEKQEVESCPTRIITADQPNSTLSAGDRMPRFETIALAKKMRSK